VSSQSSTACPFCGSDAKAVPHKGYRFKCNACGRPRIPPNAALAAPGRIAVAELKTAHQNRTAQIGWHVASVGFLGVTFVSALVAATASRLMDLHSLSNLALAVVAMIPLLLSALTFRTGNRAARRSREAVQRAWGAAALDWRRADPSLTPAGLAGLLGVEEELTTQLLAEAEVEQLLVADVSRGAPHRYRVAEAENQSIQTDTDTQEAATHRGHTVR
jgi:hypothetical protein